MNFRHVAQRSRATRCDGFLERMEKLKSKFGENVFKYIRKLRNGLGHPSTKVLVQTLRNAEAKPQTIACAETF